MPAIATLISPANNQGMVGTPFDAVDNDQSLTTVWFVVTLSGVYPTGGDILDLSGAAFGDAVKALGPPIDVNLKSFAPGGDSGFVYKYRPGTTSANGKIQVMTTGAAAQAALVEFLTAAYSAAMLADKIIGSAVFVRL